MRIVGCVAIGVIMFVAAHARTQPPAQPAAKPEVAPPPAQAHPSSACSASAAAKHTDHTCPTCGHESACATCKPRNQGCISRLYSWMTYRGERPGKACHGSCEPHHPPLYAWFPCAGGDCGSCSEGGGSCANEATRGSTRGGLACRLHGLKNCSACRGCPKGQCGAFWFVGRCKVSSPAQQNCGCGSTAQAAPEFAVPATPDAPPPVDPLIAPPMTPPIQQTASFKKDASALAKPLEPTPVKPAAPKRVSTYRPEAMPNGMPVISPEQFRKKPQP